MRTQSAKCPSIPLAEDEPPTIRIGTAAEVAQAQAAPVDIVPAAVEERHDPDAIGVLRLQRQYHRVIQLYIQMGSHPLHRHPRTGEQADFAFLRQLNQPAESFLQSHRFGETVLNHLVIVFVRRNRFQRPPRLGEIRIDPILFTFFKEFLEHKC